MSTPISEFREPIRVLIGDNDPDIPFREDAQIDAAVRTVVNLSKVVGDQTTVDNYTMDIAGAITPTLTATGDPKAYAQCVYHASRLFVADMQPTAWRTRAFSQVIGENREKIWALLEDLYNLENAGAESNTYDES
jgi:hypothetical protein